MNESLEAQVRPLLEAASFAARVHEGQTRKDGRTPYASHAFRVCLVVRDIFGFDDPRILITALLHDAIEDTTTDFDDIEDRHGREVAEWVACLTKDKTLPDDQREAAYITKLQKAPWQARVCKLADVFDNLMDTTTMPPGKKARSLLRAEKYIQSLGGSAETELQKPLVLVAHLFREMKSHPAE